MKLGDTCDKAKGLITTVKLDLHKKPENSFLIIRKLWNVFLKEKYGIELQLDSDIAFMMLLFKIGREIGGRCDDNIPDGIGYADIYEFLKYKELKEIGKIIIDTVCNEPKI